MNLIISPAKKMNEDWDSPGWKELPQFLPQTQQLCAVLRGMSYDQLKRLWKCNDQIAAQNVERLRGMDLRRRLTPALLAYEGIQYRYMAPRVFSQGEWDYVQEHLKILSGFYGLLRPLDGVTPYRLEMQAKLRVGETADLYSFWGDRLARALLQEDSCILNLASKEYSVCISRHLPPSARFITVVFGEEIGGKVVEKGTMCKMARGEMVRFLAEIQANTPEQAQAFDRLDYRFDPTRSDARTFVFLRHPAK
ncbi:peroxide stress protein YaaA [Flavonifractor sp. An100]|uniref:peroxide stress protein YaaA n=1 Tax=Flavonifractor sp. An100 TaxID=1965538 RepID=UPI000B3ABF75|nr:peroxide stress protein YaaA [Flavonifractor sp. An100]OUQ75230.1 hypothetical protein B5E43_14020 [Flavonifractor sp. An100]